MFQQKIPWICLGPTMLALAGLAGWCAVSLVQQIRDLIRFIQEKNQQPAELARRIGRILLFAAAILLLLGTVLVALK